MRSSLHLCLEGAVPITSALCFTMATTESDALNGTLGGPSGTGPCRTLEPALRNPKDVIKLNILFKLRKGEPSAGGFLSAASLYFAIHFSSL